MTPAALLDFVAHAPPLPGAERAQAGRRAWSSASSSTACCSSRSRRCPRASSAASACAGAAARPRGADPRRADRRPRPQPEARRARAASGRHGQGQGDHHLDPHPRGGRRGLHARDRHRRGRIVADAKPAELEARSQLPQRGDAARCRPTRSSRRARCLAGCPASAGSRRASSAAAIGQLLALRRDAARPRSSIRSAARSRRRAARGQRGLRRARPPRRGVPPADQRPKRLPARRIGDGRS